MTLQTLLLLVATVLAVFLVVDAVRFARHQTEAVPTTASDGAEAPAASGSPSDATGGAAADAAAGDRDSPPAPAPLSAGRSPERTDPL